MWGHAPISARGMSHCIDLYTSRSSIPIKFCTDAGVSELQRLAKCVGEASLSFPFSRSSPSINAIFRPDVTGDEPAQTASAIRVPNCRSCR